MAFSLSYALGAFGKNRTHWRKISAEADSFFRLKAAALQQMEMKREAIAHYSATTGELYNVFFLTQPSSLIQSLNARYGNAVLQLTPRSLLSLVATYHLGAIATSDASSGVIESKIRTVGFIFDYAERDLAAWCDAVSKSDMNLIAALVALGVSDAFRLGAPSKQVIIDWFPVVERVRSTARCLSSGVLLQDELVRDWLRSG